MLSKNKIKLIHSLARKKARDEEKLFLAEGDKLVKEALASGYPVSLLCGTKAFFSSCAVQKSEADEMIEVSEGELKKASLLQSPQQALAVVGIPDEPGEPGPLPDRLVLALDSVRDPGNLGTILRIADWFGIGTVFCSPETADCYNPKVVQSSMGAIFRVKVRYLHLPALLADAANHGFPVYGTFLNGESLYTSPLSDRGILVMGNEGKGISPEVESRITDRLFIPSYPPGQQSSESLNVATATAICCAEFRRRTQSL